MHDLLKCVGNVHEIRLARAKHEVSAVGTRSTASELLMREISDAVERVPTQWFMG